MSSTPNTPNTPSTPSTMDITLVAVHVTELMVEFDEDFYSALSHAIHEIYPEHVGMVDVGSISRKVDQILNRKRCS